MRALRGDRAGETLRQGADTVREELVGRLHPADRMLVVPAEPAPDVVPVEITGEEAAQIRRRPRARAKERKERGVFRLRVIDFTHRGATRVELERVDDGYRFRADIPLGVLSGSQLDALKDGSWGRKPLHLELLAKVLDGRYRSAKVISVMGTEVDP